MVAAAVVARVGPVVVPRGAAAEAVAAPAAWPARAAAERGREEARPARLAARAAAVAAAWVSVDRAVPRVGDEEVRRGAAVRRERRARRGAEVRAAWPASTASVEEEAAAPEALESRWTPGSSGGSTGAGGSTMGAGGAGIPPITVDASTGPGAGLVQGGCACDVGASQPSYLSGGLAIGLFGLACRTRRARRRR